MSRNELRALIIFGVSEDENTKALWADKRFSMESQKER